MLTMLTLGAFSSIASELVMWLNKKLSNTALSGDGAFILAAVVAIIIATAQVLSTGGSLTNYRLLWGTFAQIWAVSQVVFLIVVQRLNLTV
jgi:hypothetical protein